MPGIRTNVAIGREQREPAVTQEARDAFDYTCRHYLRLSADEFLRRYDLGEIDPDSSDPAVCRVLAMLPFAR